MVLERPYLMESAAEASRLESKTDAELAESQLRRTGLASGMRAADAGAGTGAVARIMASVVTETGSVVALDRSSERLATGRAIAEQQGVRNLEFQQADLEALDARDDDFDYVWSRFVFEYLTDPDRALSGMVRLLRPGGKIVVGDLDGNALFHYPIDPLVEDGLRRVTQRIRSGFDPFAGRKLYHRFRRAGLKDIRVHVEPYHLYTDSLPGGALENWRQKLLTIRPLAVAAFESEAAYDCWAEAFLQLLADPDVFTYSVLILVEGVRDHG